MQSFITAGAAGGGAADAPAPSAAAAGINFEEDGEKWGWEAHIETLSCLSTTLLKSTTESCTVQNRSLGFGCYSFNEFNEGNILGLDGT